MFSVFLSIIFFFLIFLFAVFFIFQAYNILFKKMPPYISTNREIIDKVVKELNFKDSEDVKVYELGCGNAGFLRTLRKKYKKVKLIGIEYSFLPIWIARVINFLRNTKIKFLKQDYLKLDFSDARMIYCYLGTESMSILGKRFEKELKKGTIIVSFRFKIDEFTPEKVITSDNGKLKVYFYKI